VLVLAAFVKANLAVTRVRFLIIGANSCAVNVGQVICAHCDCPPTDDDPAVPIRTTLLVMPSNLVSQWIDEIEAHVEPGALKWWVTCPVIQVPHR
jgi:hypothetical protein